LREIIVKRVIYTKKSVPQNYLIFKQLLHPHSSMVLVAALPKTAKFHTELEN
jgi:hypothetical protein